MRSRNKQYTFLCGLIYIIVVSGLVSCDTKTGEGRKVTCSGTTYRVVTVPEAMKQTHNGAEADAAAWNICDNRLESAYAPAESRSFSVRLAAKSSLGSVRIYGSFSYHVKLYGADGSLLREIAPSEEEGSWQEYSFADTYEGEGLTLTLEPDSSRDAQQGIRELQLLERTTDLVEEGGPSYSLLEMKGVVVSKQGSGVTGSHIRSYRVAEEALTLNRGEEAQVTIELPFSPRAVKRAYLTYKAYNLMSQAELGYTVNDTPAGTAFAVTRSEQYNPSWQEYSEELSPTWLLQGSNRIVLRSSAAGVEIKEMQLVVETASGWNSIASCSSSKVLDADSSTGTTLSFKEDRLECVFAQTESPELLLFELGAASSAIIEVAYLADEGWLEAARFSCKGKAAGWQEIPFPAGIRAREVRLSLADESAGDEADIRELRLFTAPTLATDEAPTLVVSYPRNGEYFGSEAYIRGFFLPASSSRYTAALSVDREKSVAYAGDGSFYLTCTKEADTGTEWQVVLTGEQGLQYVSRKVVLSDDLYAATSGSSSNTDESSDDTGTTTEPSEGEGSDGVYRTTVYPDMSKSIEFNDVVIEIPAGAVTEITNLQIIPLTEEDLQPLSEGMTNVTWPARGYRFLPHGVFQKDLTIRFKYDPKLLSSGQKDDDIYMYYYDEAEGVWKKLDRVSVESPLQEVVSTTNHFTDIINGTLTVPEHPDPLSYNPNSIKDMKLGDPSTGMRLIQPPGANNQGNAGVGFPIEVPPGRQGMQPNVSVQYSSGGGNGWLGLGWNIAVPNISIDTRYGVPRYDGTETYLLEGQPLVRDEATGYFHTRIEGAFSRIERKGSSAAGYYWIVTDKGGTQYVYGKRSDATSGRLKSYRDGTIFTWYLEQVIDPNGNTMTYYYKEDLVVPASGEPSTWTYLDYIAYTGHTNGEAGAYSVHFILDQGDRPDQQINCRGGFKTQNRYRLQEITVAYGSEVVYSYRLIFEEGAFSKSLLTALQAYGRTGVLFYEHSFSYYDSVGSKSGGKTLLGFVDEDDRSIWESAIHLTKRLFITEQHTERMGGSYTTSKGKHFYGGFAPGSKNKSFSGGYKKGWDESSTETLQSIMDVNGDGLPDQVLKRDGKLTYKANKGYLDGDSYFADEKEISGVRSLGEDKTKNTTRGKQLYLSLASGFYDKSSGYSKSASYYSDVNGDGLVDFVKGGNVWFNALVEGEPRFSAYSSVPFDSGSVDTSGADLGVDETRDALRAEYNREDPLRMWRAPFTGIIRISGSVSLVPKETLVLEEDDEEDEDEAYTTDDGVLVAIQKEGRVLWSARLQAAATAEEVVAVDPAGVTSVAVTAGERIYFRVNSLDDGKYDRVVWDPLIEYTDVSGSNVTDENNLLQYRYQASEDFSFAGNEVTWQANMAGETVVRGTLYKTRATSDNVTLRIIRKVPRERAAASDPLTYREDVIREVSMGWDETGEVDIEEEITFEEGAGGESELLECRLHADTPIDWSAVRFEPKLVYEDPEVVEVDEEGNESDKQFLLPVTTDIYPFGDATPSVAFAYSGDGPKEAVLRWSVERTESIGDYGVPYIAELPDDYKLHITLALKKEQELVAKVKGTIQNGTDRISLSHVLTMNPGEKFYLVCTFEEEDPGDEVNTFPVDLGVPQVHYEGETTNAQDGSTIPLYRDLPAKRFLKKTDNFPFSGGYRNWFYARWNGELASSYDPAGLSAMQQSLMVVPEEDSDDVYEQLKNFCPMTPPIDNESRANAWSGQDSDCWIGPGTVSATRSIEKYIPESYVADDGEDETIGGSGEGRGVQRYTKTRNTGTGVAVAGLSPGDTRGEAWTKIDYFDLNGDRYPDVVMNNRVQFTNPDGSLASRVTTLSYSGDIRENISSNHNLGISPTSSLSLVRTVTGSGGAVQGQDSEVPALGFSVSSGNGRTVTSRDFVDVNGDGLPDRVFMVYSDSAYGSGTLMVQYNLGYGMGEAEVLDSVNGNFRTNRTASVGLSPGLGMSWDAGGFGIGYAVNKSQSATEVDFRDINGDGLPDRVFKKISTDAARGLETSGDVYVNFNTGSGFGETCTWEGAFSDKPLQLQECIMENVSGYFEVVIPIPSPWGLIGSIIINPGGNRGKSLGQVETGLQDINGDGCVDHVCSRSNGTVEARINNTGRTNLLKTVSRPLGGSFSLEYARKGNSQEMPQSRWVLSRVTVDDGLPEAYRNDESSHSYATSFDYEGGFYSRAEREFYGFRKVITTQADGSIVTKTYAIDGSSTQKEQASYYTRSMENNSILKDKEGNPYVENITTVELKKILDNVYFPYVSKKQTLYYEGNSTAGKTATQSYTYDDYGNVASYIDYGEANDDNDDIKATLDYTYLTQPYMVNKPTRIVVYGGDNIMYRMRKATYDTKGNMRLFREYRNSGAESADTYLDYDTYGNLISYKGPPNFRSQKKRYTYSYDSETHSHITKTYDEVFGYVSYSAYETRYGKPRYTSDINGNGTYYKYDIWGRLYAVYGPYDELAERPTIEIYYYHKEVPASTRVIHKPKYDSNATIDTFTYMDGLQRVIQTRKDAEVRGSMGMSVSGKVCYDEMGRMVKQFHPSFVASRDRAYLQPAASGYYTGFTYDVLGRKTSITQPDGHAINMNYGFEEGLFLTDVKEENDDKRIEKMILKNVRGSIMSVRELLDGEWIATSYAYNPMNEITNVIDAKGNVTSVEYDMFGNRTRIVNPDTGKTDYYYDLAGNLIRKITPKTFHDGGSSINYIFYDYHYDRLIGIDYPDSPDVSYSYGDAGASWNRAGRISEVACGDMKEQRYYGKLGEMVKSVKSIKLTRPKKEWRSFSTEYEFDSLGRMTKLRYPDGEVVYYFYDNGGLLRSVKGTMDGVYTAYVKDIQYDEFGQRVFMEKGNGVITEYSYNEANRRLSHLKSYKGKYVFQDMDYSYDDVGNITKTVNDGFITNDQSVTRVSSQRFTYDEMNRLIGSTGSYDNETWLPFYSNRINSYDSTISYNEIGNITHKQQTNKGLYIDGEEVVLPKTTHDLYYEYNASQPHAVSKAGSKSYSYDANGNMTGWYDSATKETRSITWDDADRIVSIKDNSGLTSFSYDDTGTRVLKTGRFGEVAYVNSNYSIRNGEVATKHVFAGNTRVLSKMVETKDGKESESAFYYESNHIGSSSTITDKKGQFYQHIEYFPYGETWIDDRQADDTIVHRFTGQEFDKETGLYNYNARQYDPVLGKFTSCDPILGIYLDGKKGGKGVYTSINNNLYHYGGNNPLRYVDPTGCWKDESQKIAYDKGGVNHTADLNKGTVTKGDSLVKLAEGQLTKERGTNKFSSEAVANKVDQIKEINSLKSNTIQIGQELVLGISNDLSVSEQGLEDRSLDMFVFVGGAYAGYRAGAAGVRYATGRFLATDVGIKTTLTVGSVGFAAKEMLTKNTNMLNAISKIPGLGNAILKFGPQINSAAHGAIQGFTPGPPSLGDIPESVGWGITDRINNIIND